MYKYTQSELREEYDKRKAKDISRVDIDLEGARYVAKEPRKESGLKLYDYFGIAGLVVVLILWALASVGDCK